MAKKFTEEELNNIIIDYNSGMRPYELAEKYDRNASSIINKLKSLGVYVDNNYRYTKEDEEFLREYYPIGDWDSIFNRFKGVTRRSIITKVSKLGIKNESYFWDDRDIEFLKEHYCDYTSKELYEIFNRKYTTVAIKTQAFKYGLTIDDDWTEIEDELLKNNYSVVPWDELVKIIPTRTKHAIKNRAKVLHLESYYKINYIWSDQENEYLIANWKEMSDEQIGRVIGKNKESVKERRNRLGLLRVDKDYKNYPDLNKYLRGQIYEWKNQSMQNCNYQCVLTGSKDFQIHHLYSFNQIIKDMFKNNDNITVKEYNNYSKEELEEILRLFIIEQDKHPLGICIRKDIHDLFHSIYGRIGNSEKQWLEFKEDFKNGVYNNAIALG